MQYRSKEDSMKKCKRPSGYLIGFSVISMLMISSVVFGHRLGTRRNRSRR
jgi:hypothetical protein